MDTNATLVMDADTGEDTTEARKAAHAARCAAGRAAKLIRDTRTARAHVADARRAALEGTTGDERKDLSKAWSVERRTAVSKALHGSFVQGTLTHVKTTKAGERLAFHGTTIVNEASGPVTMLLKGEVTERIGAGSANGTLVRVQLERRVSTNADGVESYRYRVSFHGDAVTKEGETLRVSLGGSLAASEYVRVAVAVAIKAHD